MSLESEFVLSGNNLLGMGESVPETNKYVPQLSPVPYRFRSLTEPFSLSGEYEI